VQVRPLDIPDAYELTPVVRRDERGSFTEVFRSDALAEVRGYAPATVQANLSTSKRGVVRGVHFADVPLGQSKYVMAVRGRVLDFVVDLRVGSPSFGTWQAVELDDDKRNAVFLAEGLGHAFVALDDDVAVSYLVSDVFRPDREHGVSPLDPDLALELPLPNAELVLSPKDIEAPSLAEALARDLLPTWEQCQDRYASLRREADR
jgi:dTDP-4-dehydrorhamnose 3,5-epimerase